MLLWTTLLTEEHYYYPFTPGKVTRTNKQRPAYQDHAEVLEATHYSGTDPIRKGGLLQVEAVQLWSGPSDNIDRQLTRWHHENASSPIEEGPCQKGQDQLDNRMLENEIQFP